MKEIRKICATLVFFIGVVILSFSAQADVVIHDVRLGQHGNKIRLVFDVNQKTPFRTFLLNQPNRIIVDFPVGKSKNFNPENPDEFGYIKSVRFGALDQGGQRVVFDLGRPMYIEKAFFLPENKAAGKKNRLVIDLMKASQVTFDDKMADVFGRFRPGVSVSPPPQVDIKKATAPQYRQPLAQKILSPPVKRLSVMPVRKPLRLSGGDKKIIIIDPGHGGNDPGGLGSGGVREKQITLSIARALKRHLEATGRYKAVLTRSHDRYIKLRDRVQVARRNKGELFISLHADKIHKPSVRGASVYTLSETSSDKLTARLVEQENRSDVIAGVDLSIEDKEVADILLDLAMRETMNESKFFANTLVDEMGGAKLRLLKNTHRYAGFAVLKAPDIPSVLIEAGFLSNKYDAKMLNSRDYQEKLSSAIVHAVNTYFAKIEMVRNY